MTDAQTSTTNLPINNSEDIECTVNEDDIVDEQQFEVNILNFRLIELQQENDKLKNTLSKLRNKKKPKKQPKDVFQSTYNLNTLFETLNTKEEEIPCRFNKINRVSINNLNFNTSISIN